MDFYCTIFSYLLLLLLSNVTDGFPIMFHDNLENSTKSSGQSAEKNNRPSTNNSRIKFTAIYIFTIVWLSLIAISFVFYWRLYYLYTPTQILTRKSQLKTGKRKSQKLYVRINQRYHKKKRRKLAQYLLSPENADNESLSSNCSCDLDICKKFKWLNTNLSNAGECRKSDCTPDDKPKKTCFCCGKSKKNSQCSISKESAEVYKKKPLINLYNQEPQKHGKASPSSVLNTQTSKHSFSSQQHPPSMDSTTRNGTQPPITMQPQPMLHNLPPNQGPIQIIPLQPYSMPQSQPQQMSTQHSMSRTQKSMSQPVQTYGGSTNYPISEQEQTAPKGRCCASKKKCNGQIHAQIHGYKVEGHVRLKGKNNKQTLSIPTDTYLVNR